MAEVFVLLATYNGRKYIAEMIDSVLAQDYQDFHLIVSDDQSTDDTAGILEEYANKYPTVITHHRSNRRFGNAQDHFMYLLQTFHDAPYIMFCDQDDYWHSDKITKTIQLMKKIEQPGVPAMVHTDLRVVDRDLKELDSSFMHYSKLQGTRMSVSQLLAQNAVTGCTMMINKALADLACDNMPKEEILMHDWWLALIAATMGTTGYLDESTIDYRQHGNNVVGAKKTRSLRYILGKLRNNEGRKQIRDTYQQAALFYRCFSEKLGENERKLVKTYGDLPSLSVWKRRSMIVKCRYYKKGITRILSQLICC